MVSRRFKGGECRGDRGDFVISLWRISDITKALWPAGGSIVACPEVILLCCYVIWLY